MDIRIINKKEFVLYEDGPMAIACVLAAFICKKSILNHLDSTLRSELITNCKTIGETSEAYWVVSSPYSLKDVLVIK